MGNSFGLFRVGNLICLRSTVRRLPLLVGGFVAIFIVFQALKQRITDFIKDYDKNLGLTAKRAKKGFFIHNDCWCIID